jgi:hydroxymethylbilane synthase
VERLTIGTRGSALARWQAAHVGAALRAAHPGLEIVERILKTEGDELQQSTLPLAAAGNTGIFVKRIEQALIDREVDLAVHSLKDMPTDQPDGLAIAAVPERYDARDALISSAGWTLDELPPGTRVGTGSPRRRSQLLHRRPDIEIVPIRGNVDSRLRQVESGEVGAVVLAVAGLERLGLDRLPLRPLEMEVCLPAVGQGALALEIRRDDAGTAEIVSVLDDPHSSARVEAERAFLRRLGGGCLAPATAYATIAASRLHLEAVVGQLEGRALYSERESGDIEDGTIIGARLAERLLVAGAGRVLADARQAASIEE